MLHMREKHRIGAVDPRAQLGRLGQRSEQATGWVTAAGVVSFACAGCRCRCQLQVVGHRQAEAVEIDGPQFSCQRRVRRKTCLKTVWLHPIDGFQHRFQKAIRWSTCSRMITGATFKAIHGRLRDASLPFLSNCFHQTGYGAVFFRNKSIFFVPEKKNTVLPQGSIDRSRLKVEKITDSRTAGRYMGESNAYTYSSLAERFFLVAIKPSQGHAIDPGRD